MQLVVVPLRGLTVLRRLCFAAPLYTPLRGAFSPQAVEGGETWIGRLLGAGFSRRVEPAGELCEWTPQLSRSMADRQGFLGNGSQLHATQFVETHPLCV